MVFPEIRTDAGHRAIIYSTDAGGDCPIHGAWYCDMMDCWMITCWYKDGRRTRLKDQSALDIEGAISSGKIKVQE